MVSASRACAIAAVLVVGILLLQGPAHIGAQEPPRPTVTSERFNDYMQSHQREHALEAEALAQARTTIDQRLREMNELRAQINLERGQFISRATYDARHEQLQQRVDAIERAQSAASGSNTAWVIALGIFFTIVQIAIGYFRNRIIRTPHDGT